MYDCHKAARYCALATSIYADQAGARFLDLYHQSSRPEPLACTTQEKRRLEEQRQKELNELFAQAIKQPKVPVGESQVSERG